MYQCCFIWLRNASSAWDRSASSKHAGVIYHNFKGPAAVQLKELWMPLGPRLESSSPGCQWVVTCLINSVSLIVTHLPCRFLLCKQMQWALSPLVTETFPDRGRAACNHTSLSGLQSLWILHEASKVLNNYRPLRQSSLKLLSLFCLLRSPVTDAMSCVIILPMLMKFQKAFSWCHSSRL